MNGYLIQEKSWHAFIYKITSIAWSNWIDKPEWIYEHPNLCLYLRTLTLWFPLMVVINLGAWTSPIWISGIMLTNYGAGIMFGTWWQILQIILAALAIVFIVFGALPWLVQKLKLWLYSREQQKALASLETSTQEQKPGSSNTSLFPIVAQALRDRHDMICRPVTFVDIVPEKKE